MTDRNDTHAQQIFYQAAGSAGIAVGITAIIGALCFGFFGAGIAATMQWLVVLCLVSGGGTFAGAHIGAGAAARRERRVGV